MKVGFTTGLLALGATLVTALDPSALGWHSSHVGLPSRASFHPEGSYLFALAKEQNVFSALEAATGSIRWRHHFQDESESLIKYFLCGDKQNVVLVTSHSVHAYALQTGRVLWSHRTSSPSTEPWLDALCLSDSTPSGDVLAHTPTSIVRLSSTTGTPSWTWDSLPVVYPGTTLVALSSSVNQEGITVLLVSQNEAYSYTSLSLSTGRGGESPPLPLALPALQKAQRPLFLDAQTIAYVTHAGSLEVKAIAESAKALLIGDKGEYERIESVGLASKGIWVAMKAKGKATVFGGKEGAKGGFGTLWEFKDPLASLQVLTLAKYDASPEGMMTGFTLAYDKDASGPMIAFALQALPVHNYVPPTRYLVVTTSGILQVRESHNLLWTRSEALSAIDSGIKPLFVNPVEGIVKEVLQETWWQRMERHGDALNAFVLRQPRHHPISTSHPPQTVLLASSKTRTLFALNARTGKMLWSFYGPSLADPGESTEGWKWIKLAVDDEGRISAAASMDGDQVAAVTLDVESGKVLSAASFDAEMYAPQVVFGGAVPYTWIDKRKGKLIGVRVEGTGETDAWIFQPPKGTSIGPIATQDIQTVASLGRVVGDRSTLFKYLNPHLIAFPLLSSSTIYLLDTTTGSIATSFSHPTATELEDVTLVLRDNWLVYTHRLEGGSTAVVSAELFERDGEVQSVVKSFVSQEALKVVGVTRTKLGITSYSALFTTSTSQLVAVPRRFLDPRRPVGKPSKADQEEMLLPYDAVIPLDPRWVLSHSLDVKGLKSITAAPGARESESILIGTGLDVFGTTLAPSRSFDVLSESFNRVQLLVAVSVLTVALVVVRGMVQRNQQKQLWYTPL